MPYSIIRREDEYCVEKDSDGTIMGCHGTREGAVDQIAAIEASERQNKLLDVVLDALEKEGEDREMWRDWIHLRLLLNESEDR